MTGSTPLIVCGIDDSPGARAALEEAVRLAARRGARVLALLVFQPPEAWSAWSYGPASAIPMPEPELFRESAIKAARDIVDSVLERLGAELPTLPEVDVDARPGHPAEELVEAARDAETLVVGHRGRGAVASTFLGSTGLGCVLHAPCPVTVVPVPVPA